jgi:hypothetical protein
MAIFPWYGGLAKGWLYGGAEFLSVQDYKHLQAWADRLLERPAVQRGRMVNRTFGEPSSQLRERHDASDFETKTQDKLAPPVRALNRFALVSVLLKKEQKPDLRHPSKPPPASAPSRHFPPESAAHPAPADPNMRRYSRLNCDGLSYPTAKPTSAASTALLINCRRASCRRSRVRYCSGLIMVAARKWR